MLGRPWRLQCMALYMVGNRGDTAGPVRLKPICPRGYRYSTGVRRQAARLPV